MIDGSGHNRPSFTAGRVTYTKTRVMPAAYRYQVTLDVPAVSSRARIAS